MSLWRFFFLCCYALFVFVEAEIQSESVFVRKRDTVRGPVLSCDHDVAALRRRADLLSYIYATLAIPLIKDSSVPNIGRKSNMPRFHAIDNVYFFVVFFLIVVFFFIPMPILVFAQTAAAAALSPRAESLAMMRPNTLLASILSAMCLSEIVASRIRNM